MRRFRTRAVALATVAAVAAATTASAIAKPAAAPATTVAGYAPGDAVTDFASLPAADQGGAVVAKDGEPLSTAQLVAVNHTQLPGYRAAEIHKSGTTLRLRLLYLPEGATEGLLVERYATLRGTTMTLDAAGVVLGVLRAATAPDYQLTTLHGVVMVPMENLLACFATFAAFMIAGVSCILASPTVGPAAACAAGTATGWVGYTASSGDCDFAPADAEPEFQTVTGLGFGNNSEVAISIAGSTKRSAYRAVMAPFTTCSACRSRIYAEQSGTSWHFYTPLGGNCQTQTDYGTVYYPEGYRSDAVQVHLSQGC